jgi:chaperonin cofactor prefoldin
VKNTTGLHLMGGPITVYHDDVYAGDAVIEDLQPNEMRLISYAMDLGMEGERKEDPQGQEILSIKIVKGNLSVTRKSRRIVNYTFVVKDGKDRRLIVEHPYLQGWELVEPAKPDERTESLYRFTIPVSAKDGAKLKVVEEHVDLQAVYLTSLNTPTLVGYIQTGKMSPKVREALEKVIDLQTQLQETLRQRAEREQEIRTISEEQNRLRQNMNALDRGSDLYKRYVTKLGEQETRIETLRGEIADLQKKEQQQRKALEDYVAGLTLE